MSIGRVRNNIMSKFTKLEFAIFCSEAMARQRSGNAESYLVRKLGTRVRT